MDLRVADRGWPARCGFQPERIRECSWSSAHDRRSCSRNARAVAKSRSLWKFLVHA